MEAASVRARRSKKFELHTAVHGTLKSLSEEKTDIES